MRRLALLLLLFVAAFQGGCGEDEFSTFVVTAQVARTLDPACSTASILLGKATVTNIFHDEWMQTPEPGDTNWIRWAFPARVLPSGGATVTLNSVAVPERVSGIYFLPAAELVFGRRYDLSITTSDGKTITAHGVLPDSFQQLAPADGDSFGPEPVRVIWTSSNNAEAYLVGCQPVDSSSAASGWSDSRTDTTCLVPVTAFQDSLGTLVPGDYVVGVTAVNGGWNKSGLDLFISGGNVSGALGVFGCAVYPRPAVIRVR